MTPPVLATAAHAAAMEAIHAASFPAGEAWRASDFDTYLRLPGGFGLIDPDGGLILARVAGDEAEILTLGVVPPARRRGIARGLLRAACALAASRAAAAMFLEVAAPNRAAAALYGAEGFVEIGRRRRYYPDGADARVLRRALSPAATTGG